MGQENCPVMGQWGCGVGELTCNGAEGQWGGRTAPERGSGVGELPHNGAVGLWGRRTAL